MDIRECSPELPSSYHHPSPKRRLSLASTATHLNDIILLLENCPGQRTLSPIVQPVGICAVLDEEANEVAVSMVGSEHHLLCTISRAVPDICDTQCMAN